MTTQTEKMILVPEATVKLSLEVLQKLWLLGDHAASIANPAITAIKEALESDRISQPCRCGKETVGWCISNSCRKAGLAQQDQSCPECVFGVCHCKEQPEQEPNYKAMYDKAVEQYNTLSKSLENPSCGVAQSKEPGQKCKSSTPSTGRPDFNCPDKMCGWLGECIEATKPQPKEPEPAPLAAQKDAVFAASIEFLGTLTGMMPPPIETAPAEVFKPFRDFTEKVCSIFPKASLTDEIVVALKDARGVISSINSGFANKLIINDEPVYWQREEWVKWALNEVLPAVDHAIEAAVLRSKT